MDDSTPNPKRKPRWTTWVGWGAVVAVFLLLIDWAVTVDFSTLPIVQDFLRRPSFIPWLCAPFVDLILIVVIIRWTRKNWRLRPGPFQVSIKAWFIATAVFGAVLGLARLLNDATCWAGLGSALFGALAGGLFGHACGDARRSMAMWGAVMGALVFLIPCLVFYALVALIFWNFSVAG